jgi:hypothetical protein
VLDANQIKTQLERHMTMPVELVTIRSQTEIRVHLKPLRNAKGAIMSIVQREQLTEHSFYEWKAAPGDSLGHFVAYALNT